MYFGYLLSYCVCLLVSEIVFAVPEEEEFCSSETFQPQCSQNEIIIMHSALYGRMSIGKCLKMDIGYLGCKSDVLSYFDKKCSGRMSCNILVGDSDIPSNGGCIRELSRYLSASYTCQRVLDISRFCSSNQPIEIEIENQNIHIASTQLFDSCGPLFAKFKLRTSPGQQMNISITDLQSEEVISDMTYGSIKDPHTSRNIIFGQGSREQHLMLSSANTIDVILSRPTERKNMFVFHIAVSGCSNLSPPDGAWMTRDDGIIEIGCHVGSKVWSLTCKEGQWVGAVGQCGKDSEDIDAKDRTDRKMNIRQSDKLSLNAMLFGGCSVVILLSSIIFLIGVCLLKRRIHYPLLGRDGKSQPILLPIDEGLLHQNTIPGETRGFHMLNAGQVDPNYKSLMIKDLSSVQRVDNTSHDQPPAYYMNAGESNASDSVKYFVLEDPTTAM